MEIITVHEHADDAALDETVRALFDLQSQALKAAQVQADASQAQIWRALQAQNGAIQQQIDALRRGSHDRRGVRLAEKKEELRSYYRARDANTASAITRAAANPAVALAV